MVEAFEEVSSVEVPARRIEVQDLNAWFGNLQALRQVNVAAEP